MSAKVSDNYGDDQRRRLGDRDRVIDDRRVNVNIEWRSRRLQRVPVDRPLRHAGLVCITYR